MKKNDGFWSGFFAEVEREISNIDKLKSELRQTKKAPLISRRAQGSILHDFYNCCERIFKKISTKINGEFGESEKWHKELLVRMTILVKGVRPVVISEKIAAELDDYLSFRHVFRNIYGFELEGERLNRLIQKFDSITERFKKEIREFLKKLKK